MDVTLLARIQFAVTAGFHFLYPPLSIGLGILLIILEYQYLRTKDKMWENLTHFWVQIFALTFGAGVATGVVMEFEFGTNWEKYSRFVGDIFGSPLAAEGVFAFFLESVFLGILVFGWKRVSAKTHFISTIMVALGAHMSALWILIANSWQQTPAGYHIVNEGGFMRAEITNFWQAAFNPSTVDRLTHTLVASWLTGALLFMSINAYYILKNRHLKMAIPSMKIATVVIIVASLLQLLTGHQSSRNLAYTQPAKLAAFEGLWETKPAGLYIFGWVNEEKKDTKGIKIPGMLSILVYNDVTRPIRGLNEFEPDIPPVNFVFQTYHIMVAIGMLLILYAIYSLIVWRRHNFKKPKWYLQFTLIVFILPEIANQLGWISAEVGRQPWIVYGLLKTKDAVSTVVSSGEVVFSLILFTLIYVILLILFIYLMVKKIKQGPTELPEEMSKTIETN